MKLCKALSKKQLYNGNLEKSPYETAPSNMYLYS